MIRVGFILNFKNYGWIGGKNYFLNLISAIIVNKKSNIEPVIFTGYDGYSELREKFPNITIIQHHLFDFHPMYIPGRKLVRKIFQRDVILEMILKKNEISVLSHFGPLGRRSTIPTIGWIPDFQHKYLPDLFSKEDLLVRDNLFLKICSECTQIIFSSNTAKSDAERFFSEYTDKFKVLHFTTGNIKFSNNSDFESLKKKYGISEPFFIVPNQFWVHKNHMVVIDALKILKEHNSPVTILSSGDIDDFRNPEYFHLIQEKIDEYKISEFFKILGVIPYEELTQLMMNSVAVINPSKFEGWSSTVEEAKTLNLKIILSDIEVHREQNPEKGIFFSPDNPRELAEILQSCVKGKQDHYNNVNFTSICENKIKQQIIFAQNYEKIVQETLEYFQNKN